MKYKHQDKTRGKLAAYTPAPHLHRTNWIKLADPADHQSKYMCGRGLLAYGVTGYAIKKNTLSPRTIWIGELTP